ncbi:MAG: TetR/AcrR family transcriptional regulator [Paracoccaceae bacterium]|nr:TetR/AcrR family transcriptional regulator [Paracoccaceae bacterium]
MNSPDSLAADLWIDAAYELLIDGGVDAVKVQPLARALNLTRTAFYWHFKDREALLEALLARWETKNTGNLIARTEAFAETINEAILNVFDAWLMPDIFDARFDFAVRTWALADAGVKAKVQANDATRTAALKAMFARFDYDPAMAETRALALYYTQIGYFSMMVSETTEVRVKRMPNYVETYSGRKLTEAEWDRFVARHS